MDIEIKRWDNGEIIIAGKYESIKDCLEKNRSADLRFADLSSADLRFADLSSADLSSADLRFADLSSADLRSANLRFADLSSANLRFADLSSANLRFADLRSADLSSADLRSAINFFHSARLGELSDKLTLELMRWDATICGEKLMDEWVNGGPCPFGGNGLFSRLFYFSEKKHLWKRGKPELTLRQVYEAMLNELKTKR